MNNIEFKDVEQQLENLSARIAKIESIDDIAGKKTQLAALEAQSAEPSFWNDTKKAKDVSRQIDLLKNSIETFHVLRKKIEDDRALFELCKEMQAGAGQGAAVAGGVRTSGAHLVRGPGRPDAPAGGVGLRGGGRGAGPPGERPGRLLRRA